MTTDYERLAHYYDTNDFSHEAAESTVEESPSRTAPVVEPMDSFTVRLPVSLLDKVRSLAAEKGLPTGAMLRNIIQNAVAGETDDDATVSVAELRRLIATADKGAEYRTKNHETRSSKSLRGKRNVARSVKTGKPRKRATP